MVARDGGHYYKNSVGALVMREKVFRDVFRDVFRVTEVNRGSDL
jgi:hypothetical protein